MTCINTSLSLDSPAQRISWGPERLIISIEGRIRANQSTYSLSPQYRVATAEEKYSDISANIEIFCSYVKREGAQPV